MQITIHNAPLQLEHPFKLSYGTTTVRKNILVNITHEDFTGTGEAAVVPYYTSTPEGILRYLTDPALGDAIGDDPLLLEDALDRLPSDGPAAARAAVDIALHDLWGQRLGQPLYQLWGLNPARIPQSSYTVTMADDEVAYRERVRAAKGYQLIKLKLGSGSRQNDLQMVRIAREETDAQLCVDVNGGWSAADALAMIPRLAEYDLTFVEQPIARDDFEGWRLLRASLPADRPPLIADESVQGVASVPPLAGIVDGVNIKLAKCGGLRAARQMIALARAYDMQVLIGCMIESSVAVTAAAHLAPMADYADLDGNLLITNDPYRGAVMSRGYLTLPDAPGLGVTPVVD